MVRLFALVGATAFCLYMHYIPFKSDSQVFLSLLKEIFLLIFFIASYIIIRKKGDDTLIKFKINIADALERRGFNSYQAKKTKILSQDTLKKIKNEDANISLESLNRICMLLDMQPKDLIEYVEDVEELGRFKLK